MAMWECPACGRMFGRNGQAHVCAPAMTLDDYYATRPPEQRETCEAVIRLLRALGDVTVEPVGIGILFKKRSTFAELRPRRDHQALTFGLPHDVDHARITRRTAMKGTGRFWFGVAVRSPGDIDDLVNEWLAEAYHESA